MPFHVDAVCLRLKEGLEGEWTDEISIWHVKRVLISLEHINLSVFHVHALLSVLEPNPYYFIDTMLLVRVVCTYVPLFFNARNITQSALETAKEKADAQAAKELRELQEFQSREARLEASKEDVDAPEETEDVEKTLVQMFQLHDRGSGERGRLELKKFAQLCQDHLPTVAHFSQAEVRAFIAHAELDGNAEVTFAEHTKEVVSLIFEFRKCRYLNELVHAEALPLVELDHLDEVAGERDLIQRSRRASMEEEGGPLQKLRSRGSMVVGRNSR